MRKLRTEPDWTNQTQDRSRGPESRYRAETLPDPEIGRAGQQQRHDCGDGWGEPSDYLHGPPLPLSDWDLSPTSRGLCSLPQVGEQAP
jgi:hypothetical protein